MTTLEIILLIAVEGFICVFSFIKGAQIGQKVVRGETVETPQINPVKTIKEYNENREVKKEQERDRIIAENIDSYNGTAYGQKEIPR